MIQCLAILRLRYISSLLYISKNSDHFYSSFFFSFSFHFSGCDLGIYPEYPPGWRFSWRQQRAPLFRVSFHSILLFCISDWYTIAIHILRPHTIFWYTYTMCNDPVMVTGISTSSNIHLFFVLGAVQFFSSGYFEIDNKLLWTVISLLFYQTLEHCSWFSSAFLFSLTLGLPVSPCSSPAPCTSQHDKNCTGWSWKVIPSRSSFSTIHSGPWRRTPEHTDSAVAPHSPWPFLLFRSQFFLGPLVQLPWGLRPRPVSACLLGTGFGLIFAVAFPAVFCVWFALVSPLVWSYPFSWEILQPLCLFRGVSCWLYTYSLFSVIFMTF